MIIVLLKSAFLFFVLTSGRPLRVTTFFVFSKPLCSADRDSGIFCTAAKALFIAVKGLSTAARNSQNLLLLQPALIQLFCSASWSHSAVLQQRCSFRTWSCSPLGFQILRIDWEGMKDDALTHGSSCRLCKEYSLTLITTNLWCQKMPEKDVVGNVTSDLITLLPTSHIIAYITIIMAITQVLKKPCNVNSKIAQTMQSIWNFIVEKSTLQEHGTSVIIWEISDPKFIWKLGDKSKIWSLPDFLGELTALILEHYELHCYG